MPAKKLFLATLLAGLVLFVWGAISHALLPFYNTSFKKFTNEEQVAQVVSANVLKSGTYFLPYEPQVPDGATDEQKKASMVAFMDRMTKGPFVFASIRVGGMWSFGGLYSVQIVTNLLTGLLLASLLWSVRHLSFRNRIW
ncbi:MAG TPA: hypothetical protein DCP63_07410, partial [Bacteroidetes bacterium]|nr:hypothetical protein [Bacteroidota bacterium]